MLYIFSGLPGTGKTTLSSALTKDLKATYQYNIWDRDHIVIDTANQTVSESLMILYEKLNRER